MCTTTIQTEYRIHLIFQRTSVEWKIEHKNESNLHVFFLDTILSDHLDLVINQIEKLAGFKKTSQKISNLKSLSSSEKLKKFLDKWKYFMTLHWMIFQVSNMQNSHYQSKYWLCNFHQY